MKRCEVPDCNAEMHARDWCRKHYDRWIRNGDPKLVLPTGPRPNLLPNPWVNEAPACPRGCPPLRVYLWAAEGTLRWMCATHALRFDAPTSQVPCGVSGAEGT